MRIYCLQKKICIIDQSIDFKLIIETFINKYTKNIIYKELLYL